MLILCFREFQHLLKMCISTFTAILYHLSALCFIPTLLLILAFIYIYIYVYDVMNIDEMLLYITLCQSQDICGN